MEGGGGTRFYCRLAVASSTLLQTGLAEVSLTYKAACVDLTPQNFGVVSMHCITFYLSP